jgi:hypothetical protein
MRPLIWHADVVDHYTEEERQTDRGDHPRTTQVLIHMCFAEADQRHQAQPNTSSSSDCESDERSCAALLLGQREPAERGCDNQSETTLECVRYRSKRPRVMGNLQR